MLTLNGIKSTETLTTTEGIQAYLSQTPFSASAVKRLSGGFANFTFRVTLASPDQNGRHSVIVKHATAYAAGWTTIPLNLDRTDIEVAALNLVARQPFMSELKAKKVVLPELLAYDQENRVQIYRDYGPLLSIKDYIIAHPDAEAIGQEAGEALGEFLAELHVWGYQLLHPGSRKDGDGDPSELDMFKNNETSKQLCAWRTLGRLVETGAKYEVSGDWAEIAKKATQEVTELDDTFNMADFWTGNVLVETADTESGDESIKSLIILDWELAKTGPASADIAQFAAEAYELEIFTPSSAGFSLLQSFLSTYTSSVKSLASTSTNPDAVTNTLLNPSSVLIHMSTHVSVFGDYAAWAKEEETKRKVILNAFDVCKRTFAGEIGNVELQDIRQAWGGN
ncbi:hypothetical protein CPB86DRAFT_788183 [Serendipita vermifera]|nr:hypothetical protein CPB86DRAFT_788183 [Serendipita vermifera]